MKKNSVIVLVVLLLLVLGGIYGYNLLQQDNPDDDIGDSIDNGDDNGSDNGDGLEQAQLPIEVQDWVENSRNLFLGQARVFNTKTYILVTYGLQPTGGYVVDITDVAVNSDKIIATVNFKRPAPDEMVTQAITYPYDLHEVDVATDLPVEFVPTGDELHVPLLVGVDELQPIVAQSNGIKVFYPAPDEIVPRNFEANGIANVFEGNVLYSLLDSSGNELHSGFTNATQGDWGYFTVSFNIDTSIATAEKLNLQFYTESARDGSVQDLVEIPLMLQ